MLRKGFTWRWYIDLWADDRMLHAFRNRLLVAFAVVIIAVIVGTAAAILINSVSGRLRTTLQDMMIATILIPGVMIGIPTMIMWTMIGGVLFGVDRPWPFIPGLHLGTWAQLSYITVLARLQSFDAGPEEAALDHGATQAQAQREEELAELTGTT